MTDADFKRIAAELGHPVPRVYREFMLANAAELRAAAEAMPLRSMIYLDPQEVIDSNRFAREHPTDVFPIGEDDEPFPDTYFLIGDNGGGDYWFLKRDKAGDGAAAGVWYYECESHEVSKSDKSLDDYLAKVRKDMKKPQKWQ